MSKRNGGQKRGKEGGTVFRNVGRCLEKMERNKIIQKSKNKR